MTDSRGMLKNIQAARAIAALCVVAYHLGILSFGQCGVDVFFVISGFIMSHVAPKEGRSFFLKRIIRIAPLYWLLTIGVYAIAVVKPQWLNTTTEGIPYLTKSLLFIPYLKENGNWGPLLRNGWTLSFEMFFYVVVAISLLCVKARYATLLSSAILLLFCGVAATHGTGNLVADYLAQPLVLEFCLGVACYWISTGQAFIKIAPIIWAGIGVASVITIYSLHAALGDPVGFDRVVRYGLPAFLIILSLLGLERAGISVKSAVLAELGAASYSIYLLHPYAIGVMEKILGAHVGQGTVKGVALAMAVIVGVCMSGWACYKYFESPVQSMLRRSRGNMPRANPAA